MVLGTVASQMFCIPAPGGREQRCARAGLTLEQFLLWLCRFQQRESHNGYFCASPHKCGTHGCCPSLPWGVSGESQLLSQSPLAGSLCTNNAETAVEVLHQENQANFSIMEDEVCGFFHLSLPFTFPFPFLCPFHIPFIIIFLIDYFSFSPLGMGVLELVRVSWLSALTGREAECE